MRPGTGQNGSCNDIFLYHLRPDSISLSFIPCHLFPPSTPFFFPWPSFPFLPPFPLPPPSPSPSLLPSSPFLLLHLSPFLLPSPPSTSLSPSSDYLYRISANNSAGGDTSSWVVTMTQESGKCTIWEQTRIMSPALGLCTSPLGFVEASN